MVTPNKPILVKIIVKIIVTRKFYCNCTYLSFCYLITNFFFRRVSESDIVMPEEARSVARELNIPYYETSVLTYFGIDEVD